MQLFRTPVVTDLPILLADAKAHARVDYDDEDTLITGMIAAAAAEIEATSSLALLTQTITVITDGIYPARRWMLPVGPVAADAVVTVETLADDGEATALTGGYWLEGQGWPNLRFAEAVPGTLRISYPAGMAASPAGLPDDLRHAIADQVARYYDQRGGVDDKGTALSPMCARVIARYRRVRI